MSNSQNHHGRFGWIPEISTTTATFQNTSRYDSMEIQNVDDTSFSSRSFLDQCGIFLAAHTAYDLSKTVSQPLDAIHTLDIVSEYECNDPSHYFIELQEVIENILQEENLRRREAATVAEKKTVEEKKKSVLQNHQNTQKSVELTSKNLGDIQEPYSNEFRPTYSNVAPSQPFTCAVKNPHPTALTFESPSVIVSSLKPNIDQGSHESKSTPLAITLDDNLDPFIKEKLQQKDWWINFLNNDFAAVKSESSVHTKRLRISVKKVIMLAINQLAGTSSQVESVFNKLAKLLETIYHKGEENGKDFRFYHYALTIVVESLMNCVETQVVCNPRSVWEFGQLVSRLCIFEKFEYFFECFLLHRCHFVVPLPEDSESLQNIKHQSLPFLDRLVAYLRLWLVFLVITQKKEPIWCWYARFLNARNPSILAPRLLVAALDVSGFFLLKEYPKQFHKILSNYIQLHMLPMYNLMKAREKSQGFSVISAAITQLEIYLTSFNETGKLSTPEGYTLKLKSYKHF